MIEKSGSVRYEFTEQIPAMEALISRGDEDVTIAGTGKRRKLGFQDEESVIQLQYRSRRDGDVKFPENVASTTSGHANSVSDLKAVCVSEADMFVAGNDGFRDEGVMISGAGKRRKLGFEDEESVIQLRQESRDGDVNFHENVASTTTVSGSTSDHLSSFSDLKAVCVSETDIFISGNDGFSRDTSASSVVCFESEEMDSPSTGIEACSHRKLPPATAVTMPSAAELEEFFSEAEKYEQKRFVEKYNFDIKKDVPMEGRYQWVPLNR